jgi:predicted small secreted protein
MHASRLTRLASVVIALAALGTLPACNTVEGAGQDIESAGEAIDRAAEDVAD